MFNDRYGLTEAVLRGRKTMTRRVIDGLNSDHAPYGGIDGTKHYVLLQNEKSFTSAYGLGEEIAIAQSYRSIHEEMMNGDYGDGIYDAFRWAVVDDKPGWNNKMFTLPMLMPHRIRITDIKVERLQDVSKEDCLKEGIDEDFADGVMLYWFSVSHKGISWEEYKKRSYELSCHERHGKAGNYFWDSPQKAFAALIDCVSSKGTWDANPWVFAYEFELIC